MVGPRRPLRRSITPGTLKRTEQPTLPLRETEDSLGRQMRIRRPSGRPTKEKAARSLRTGSIRCCMAGSGVEWLAARSARRVAPEGAAQGAAGPSVTASRSPSPCLPVAQRQTHSRPRRRRLSDWGFDWSWAGLSETCMHASDKPASRPLSTTLKRASGWWMSNATCRTPHDAIRGLRRHRGCLEYRTVVAFEDIEPGAEIVGMAHGRCHPEFSA